MGEKKIQKFARRVAEYFDKYFTVYVYKDPNTVKSMLIGLEHIIIAYFEVIDPLIAPTLSTFSLQE
jgi:hypothetical protein